MTRDDVIDLLTLAAAYDQRTVGEADIVAWLAVATAESWRYTWARRALVEYHKRGGHKPRIKPADITDILDTKRGAVRKQLLKGDLFPPRELRDDPHAEIRWRRTYAAELVNRALDAWADGRPFSELEAS